MKKMFDVIITSVNSTGAGTVTEIDSFSNFGVSFLYYYYCYYYYYYYYYCLCGLVVRVPGYRSSGPDSIPGATSFSEK
jgi:hypothetical protein